MYLMKTVTFNQPGSKKCPFCSETIRVEAIKCRFCAEFLNTDEAKALEAELEGEATQLGADALFDGRPSLLGMVGAAIKGAILVTAGLVISSWPVERVANGLLALDFGDNELVTFGGYRVMVGLGKGRQSGYVPRD
jgi:hypothetical protein